MSYSLDTTHSSVEFSVRHMGLATVKGRFREFDVQVDLTDDGTPRSVRVVIAADSIDTGVEDRDAHLRSPDFFNAEANPEIVFEASDFRDLGDAYEVNGQLTMNGVTQPVSLSADVTGPIKDPWGNDRFAAAIKGKVDRTKFGLKWNQVLEAGSLLVGEQVSFNADVQVVKVPEAEPALA